MPTPVDLIYATSGAQVTFVYRVTNSGDTYLAVPTISDPDLSIDQDDMTLKSGTFPLAPAATATYWYETTVAADHNGTATVTSNPVESDGDDMAGISDVTDDDAAAVDIVAPAVTLNKLVYAGHDNGASA
jgi:hypothetical protein